MGGGILCIMLITVMFLNIYTDMQWYHNTFIFRFPVFTLGVLTWLNKKIIVKKSLFIFSAMFVLSVIFYEYGYGHTYFMVYMLAPFVIMCVGSLSLLLEKNQSVLRLINYIGSHSLEIYVANSIVLKLSGFNFTLPTAIIYFVFTITMSVVLISLNIIFIKCFARLS